MGIINIEDKILIADPRVNTTYGGPDSLKKLQPWTTVGELGMVAAQPLTFITAKTESRALSIEGMAGGAYALGIDFNNLTMEEGASYTLLIDRFKPAEIKTTNPVNKYRKGRYYHETVADAATNGRFSELPITAVKGQFFDFIPEKYFKQISPTELGHGTGMKGRRYINHGGLNGIKTFVKLGFRIRIEKDGKVTETNMLGTVSAVCNTAFGGGNWISYSISNQ